MPPGGPGLTHTVLLNQLKQLPLFACVPSSLFQAEVQPSEVPESGRDTGAFQVPERLPAAVPAPVAVRTPTAVPVPAVVPALARAPETRNQKLRRQTENTG